MTAVPPDRRRQQRDRTRPLGRDIMSQEPWGACGWQGPCFRLRGWLARYVWPSYDQARFIQAAKRDIKKLVEGEPELH
jgi:hypothetical protein